MVERQGVVTISMTKTYAVVGNNRLANTIASLFKASKKVNMILLNTPVNLPVKVDVVFETENLHLEKKRQQLVEIEKSISDQTLILSSVLGITATEIAASLRNPSRIVGYGAFANLQTGDLIEIAPAFQTDSSYVEMAINCFEQITDEVEVVEDEVGLVYPRILSMIINEATFALMEKTSTIDDIDTAMKKGTNYPYGPFEWADEIGLDDIYAVLSGLQRSLGEERYRPSSLLKKMVYAHWLGKESERGFYFHNVQKENVR